MNWKRVPSGALIETGVFLLWVLATIVFTLAVLCGDSFGQERTATPQAVYATPELSQGRERGVLRVKNAYCVMTLRGQQCSEAFGSGTVIGTTDDSRLIVLSCAHVFRERGKAQIEVGNRVWRDAAMRAIDHKVDLSLLIVDPVDRIAGVTIAEAVPSTSDPLITRGYPSASMYIERPARVIGSSNHLWTVDCRPIQGESGGCLLSPAGLVGVLVLTEGEDPENPQFNPGGHVVGWPTIRQFVNATFPNQRPSGPQAYQRDRDQRDPNDRGPIPLAPAPLPQVQQAPPKTLAPQVKPEEAPQAKPEQAPPVDIDWSLAKVVVLVPRQKELDGWDWLVRTAEKLTSEDTGPGQLARRLLSDSTNGKVDAEIVYQRIEPQRYDKLVEASGVRVGRYAGVVIAIRSQQESMFEPFRKMAIAFGERAVKSKLGDVPCELILERTSPGVFAATQDALAFREPEGSSPGNWLTALLGPLAGWASEWLRQRKEVARLWTLS